MSAEPIVSNDIKISFRRLNIRVAENAGEVDISIIISGNHLSPVTVYIRTVDGTATGGVDYRRTRGPITFDPEDSEIVIAIKIIDDVLPEPDETFTVQLYDASLGVIPLGLNEMTVTIADDDGEIFGRRNSSLAAGPNKPQPHPKPTTANGPFFLTSKFCSLHIDHASVADEYKRITCYYSLECPDHLILKACADTCPPTCDSMFGRAPCASGGCIRGCFCPNGLVKESQNSEKCIKPSQCPTPPRQPCSKGCVRKLMKFFFST